MGVYIGMDKKKSSLAFLIVWLVIMAAGTVLMFIGITHESLWYDESYSAALVKHSIPDIINITGGDSHPPLYYLLLHFFTLIFGNSVFALRAFSVLGVVALASLGIGPVRRALGNRFGLIYTLLTFALPITLSMAQEARMYTWAAFFVTGSALWGYLGFKEGRLRDWIIFGVCTLCAAYTHYYALLAVVMICAILFVMMLAGKKKLKPFLITAGAAAVLYIPWIIKLAAQASRISGSYWIPEVTADVIRKTLIYPFSNKFSYPLPRPSWFPRVSWLPSPFSSPSWQVFVDIVLYVSVALILFGIIYRIVRRDENVKLAILAVGAYVLTIGAGIIASFVIRPVLVERYMMPVLGLFILGLSFGIGSLGKKILPAIGCAVIIAFTVPQIDYTMSKRFNGPMTEAAEYMESRIQPGDVFLHTDEHTIGTFCYYFPDNTNYYYQREGFEGFSNFDAFGPNGVVIDSLDEVKGERIWLVQRYGAGDTISAGEWIGSGKLKPQGNQKSFRIDTSWYSFMIRPMALGSASPVKAVSASSGALTVTVSGLKNGTGNVLFNVYIQDPANTIANAAANIKDGKAEAVFADLPFGEYAILVLHDENGNQQVDMAGEVPVEGIGYSNTSDAPQGPPVYETCKFTFNADNTVISIPVFYYEAP